MSSTKWKLTITSAQPHDGRSLVPLLRGGGGEAVAAAWPRTYTLQEGYESCEAGHGEGKACSKKGDGDGGEPKSRDYSALRLRDHVGGSGRDALYVEYTDGGKMFFDMAVDPWQINNKYDSLSANESAALAAMIARVRDCKGTDQCP